MVCLVRPSCSSFSGISFKAWSVIKQFSALQCRVTGVWSDGNSDNLGGGPTSPQSLEWWRTHWKKDIFQLKTFARHPSVLSPVPGVIFLRIFFPDKIKFAPFLPRQEQCQHMNEQTCQAAAELASVVLARSLTFLCTFWGFSHILMVVVCYLINYDLGNLSVESSQLCPTLPANV